MLTIGKLGGGQEAYYLDKVAQGAEDYYTGEGEAEGRWTGDAACELGLEGEVGADQLTAMLTGRDPGEGEPLLGMSGVPSGRGAVPGFDLTFSAPKSVSLLWALGDEPTQASIRDAHERSVDAALAYMQREACWTRRGKGGAEFVRGNGYIAAAFRHRSSRAGDPQLHTHVLIANATRGPDGRWTRLFHPAIYDHAKTAGYLYEAQLRHELARTLGVSWQPVRRGIAELAGFKDEQLRRFSTRRAEILAAVGGPDASARARQMATLDTRRAKEPHLSPQTMRERWYERAAEVGLDAQAIERVLGRNLQPRAGCSAVLTAEQVDRAVTAQVSHFDRRDVVQAVANLLPEGREAKKVEQTADAYLATDHLVRIGESPKGERFTTRRIWELEQIALTSAQRMRAEPRALAGEAVASRVIEDRPSLKADQRQMVKRLLTGSEGIAIVIGEAGSGKSYAIAAAAQGWAQVGIEMRAAAPTWQAANVLGAEGLRAQSIAGLLGELDDYRAQGLRTLEPESVLLIDEAAMVDSATLARLIDHADGAGAKLVLVGDPEQLPELEAGGLFSALAGRSEPIRLREVIRHHDELDRDAARLIRTGGGVEALELYRAENRVVVAPDSDGRRFTIVADWFDSYSQGSDAVMICQRNSEVERLNQFARSVLREHGLLGDVEVVVGGAGFAVGDQVVTRVNAPGDGVTNRMRWQVAEIDTEHHAVKLDCLDRELRVVLGLDYLEQVNSASGAPALQHAYAANLYIAQGATFDQGFVMADVSMSQQDFYVAMSRARNESYLYAIPEVEQLREEFAPRDPGSREALDHIRAAMQRDEAQIAASDERLRAPLRQLSTPELVARHDGLADDLRIAAGQAERESILQKQIASAERSLAERAEWPGREKVQRLRAELEGGRGHRPAPSLEARAALTAVESELAHRRQLTIRADRLFPPAYITKAIGEKPSDPAKLAGWEHGVGAIERHRQAHGITDTERALGSKPRAPRERAARRRTELELRRVQRQLQITQDLTGSRVRGIEREIVR